MFRRTFGRYLNYCILAFLLCGLWLHSSRFINRVPQDVNARGQTDKQDSLKPGNSFNDAHAQGRSHWPLRPFTEKLALSDSTASGSRRNDVSSGNLKPREDGDDGLPEAGSCDNDVSWHGSNLNDHDSDAPAQRALAKRALTWDEARRKGADLICLMDMSKEDAENKLQSQNPAWHASSPYATIGDLRRWGYRGKYLCDIHPLAEINDMLSAKGILGAPDSGSDNVQIRWMHEESYAAAGSTNKDQPPTMARYQAYYNGPSNAILVEDAFGPAFRVKWKDDKRIPDLKRWSEITYISWKAISQNPQSLKYIVIMMITNQDTKGIISQALRNKGIPEGVMRTPHWDEGAPRFVRDSEGLDYEAFEALLATPNVLGTAWMLIQRKDELGHKRVAAITPFAKDETAIQSFPYLLIELEDVGKRRDGDGTAALVKRGQLHRHHLIKRALTWETAKRDGADLMCLMDMSKADAEAKLQALDPKYHASSPFKDFSDLRRWGWTEERDSTGEAQRPLTYITSCMRAMRFSTNLYEDVDHIAWEHTQKWAKSDASDPADPAQRTESATGSMYNAYHNPAQHVIYGYNALSPRFATRHFGHPEDSIPDLNQWSDVTFISWQASCYRKTSDPYCASKLQYLLRLYIVNDDTTEIMKMAVKTAFGINWHKDPKLPAWTENPPVFRRDSEGAELAAFQALLGTPNTKCICWMLIQRKTELGRKRIKQVTVFKQDGEPMVPDDFGIWPYQLVELEDVPEVEGRGVGGVVAAEVRGMVWSE
ncbi:hypothetical protein LTS18_006241 [Coniosporium uncinatum]|uniref:Uncharacterized protein n=1 Tax=Coniosporium uncinatum TaxID=93489 RepID=A0ACC3DXD1_9PEZI|nr:hypothetical protein LTS18_006241 [Coniosporium uncinatum]